MTVEINDAIKSLVLRARTDVDKAKKNLNGTEISKIGLIGDTSYYDGICDALLALGIIVQYNTGEIITEK